MRLNTDRVLDVLDNAERYHAAQTFGGPSLYFHQRALETRHAPTSLEHLEYVYATLASWGMHRMGKGGSKMCSFGDFRTSVEGLSDQILRAQGFVPAMTTEEAWGTLKEIFIGITVMASKTLLVGNSKVMHQMLPNIVPPIDREYTLRYLCGKTMLVNDPEREWQIMRSLISGFFIPLCIDKVFAAKAEVWITAKRPWDTSVMKVIDNLLIGVRKPAAV